MSRITPQQVAQQIHELPQDKRLVFIHPNYRMQHLVIGELSNESIYVRLTDDDLNRDQLHAQCSTLSLDGAMYLILDEIDRARPQELPAFLHSLLEQHPNARVVLLSRSLPDGIFRDDDIARQSAFVPTDSSLMLWDYARRSSATLLEVRAFGDGRVHVDGKLVGSWDGALPRALFFYFVDRGMVTRSEIFDTFWPDLSVREATNVFHVTKRKISEVLGTELTLYGSGFYHISPKINLSYDVAIFNGLIQNDDPDATNVESLEQALDFYRDDYLTSLNSAWTTRRRDDLQQAGCDAIMSLARHYENSDEVQKALSLYLRMSRIKPEREDAAAAVMRLFDERLGQPHEAMAIYRRLENALQKRLGVAPSRLLQQLAAQIEQHAD